MEISGKILEKFSHLNRKACDAFDLNGKWEKTGLAQKRARQAKRAGLNDFERFKVMLLRKRVS